MEVRSWTKKELGKGIELGLTDGTRQRDFASREEVVALIVRSKG